MKPNFLLKPLILMGLFGGFVPMVVAQCQANIIAQLSDKYDYYMKIGYEAMAKRDYQIALVNFRRALKLRPSDRYAQKAVASISKYLTVIRGRKRQGIIIFIPAYSGKPDSKVNGAIRGGCSISTRAGAKNLIALIPYKAPALTAESYPDILYYIPQVFPTKDLEFALIDEQEREIYTKTFRSGGAGIAKLSLSTFKGIPPLQIGKTYRWYLSIVCLPDDRSGDVIVGGGIQRIDLDPLLKEQLSQASLLDRVALYAIYGIWHDAIAHLYTARQKNPQDILLERAWIDLLTSISINNAIAESPLAR